MLFGLNRHRLRGDDVYASYVSSPGSVRQTVRDTWLRPALGPFVLFAALCSESFGDIRRDPPRLILAEQLGGRTPSRLVLE